MPGDSTKRKISRSHAKSNLNGMHALFFSIFIRNLDENVEDLLIILVKDSKLEGAFTCFVSESVVRKTLEGCK